jgi:AcrR family transcriptional regulator
MPTHRDIAVMGPAPSARKRSDGVRRREQILTAAARLFAEKGFSATAIDEVGDAAGITGSGVYRHFSGKEALYREVIDRVIQQRVDQVAQLVETATSPEDLLCGLVDNLADVVLEHPTIAGGLWRGLENLDVEGSGFYDRLHRLNVDQFVDALSPLRPGLTIAQCRSLVDAFYGLVLSITEFESGLSREQLRRLLNEVGVRMLLG